MSDYVLTPLSAGEVSVYIDVNINNFIIKKVSNITGSLV